MILRQRFLDGILAGTVSLAFRRWRRPTVRPGTRLRTAVGVVEIGAMTLVRSPDVSEADARRAGYASRGELLAELDRYGDDPLHRIELRFGGPDPRAALRERDELDEAEHAEVARRLARLDAASRPGPWTSALLRLVSERPATRAADLAASIGRDTVSFKADVRKLKELGLTESLEVGYRLSPRGHAVFRRLSAGTVRR